MNIRLMRGLDFGLGVPLCFILQGVACVFRPFCFKRREKGIRNALFIKLSEMGAILLSFPLLARIKRECPEVRIYFITFSKNRPVFDLFDIVLPENIFCIRDDSIMTFIVDTAKLVFRMRKENIDIVFDLEFFSRFTALLTYSSAAGKRVGFFRYAFEGLYRGDFLTHKVQYNPLLHVSKSFLSLSVGINMLEKPNPELCEEIKEDEIIFPQVIPSKPEENKMRDKLKMYGISNGHRVFIFNLGEGNIALREWPLDNFIELGVNILDDSKNFILLIGTQNGANKARIFSNTINSDRVVDLISKTTLRELLMCFNIAAAFITSDCGLAHVASLSPVQKIVLFGPESPGVFAPLGENVHIVYSNLPCSPCLSVLNHRMSACTDNKCLKNIEPSVVYNIIKGFL